MADDKAERRQFIQEELEIFGGPLYRPKVQPKPKSTAQTATALFEEPAPEGESMSSQATTLAEFREEIQDCTRCELSQTRHHFVFGDGNPHADLMFIGEAPGEQEDLQGIPFVGRAGKLLDDILKAIDLTREQVFIANVLKCRPPNNRDPKTEEIELCEPYLKRQIELIQPKLIVALGRISATTLLRSKDSLGHMRGKVYSYHGTDMVVTYHPAALLRNPNWKRPAWEDFKKIRDMYREKTR